MTASTSATRSCTVPTYVADRIESSSARAPAANSIRASAAITGGAPPVDNDVPDKPFSAVLLPLLVLQYLRINQTTIAIPRTGAPTISAKCRQRHEMSICVMLAITNARPTVTIRLLGDAHRHCHHRSASPSNKAPTSNALRTVLRTSAVIAHARTESGSSRTLSSLVHTNRNRVFGISTRIGRIPATAGAPPPPPAISSQPFTPATPVAVGEIPSAIADPPKVACGAPGIVTATGRFSGPLLILALPTSSIAASTPTKASIT